MAFTHWSNSFILFKIDFSLLTFPYEKFCDSFASLALRPADLCNENVDEYIWTSSNGIIEPWIIVTVISSFESFLYYPNNDSSA